jgi:hypothetical protein
MCQWPIISAKVKMAMKMAKAEEMKWLINGGNAAISQASS